MSRPRVAVVTCLRHVASAEEDRALIAVLKQMSIDVTHAAWDDEGIDWHSFDLSVVRSVWDYTHRRDEFLAWTRRPPRVLNSPDVLAWNTDKRYLADLAAAGVPVAPTRFVAPADCVALPEPPFVVKPAVSNGAQDTAWYRGGDEALAYAHVARLHAAGRTVLIQPYLASVAAEGEAALVFFAGRFSHAVRREGVLKQAASASDVPVPPAGIRLYAPTARERAVAEAALACAPGGAAGLVFGRVDLVAGPGGAPVVMEVELTEPALFLSCSEGSVERLADAVAAALG